MPDRHGPIHEALRLRSDAMPGDFLREALRAALREFMEIEVSRRCPADRGERTEDRGCTRNGYRERDLGSRPGTLEPRIPKPRHGAYLPGFPHPRRRWEPAFVQVVAGA